MPPASSSSPLHRAAPRSTALQLEVDLLAETPAGDVSREDTSAARLVLVADDDPDLRRYLRRCLEALGLRVAEAEDGQDALALARREPPALVVADVRMPRLDGLALRAALAADAALATVPVLLMTGDGAVARAVGPCLEKPFNARLLREHLRLLLPDPAGDRVHP